MNFRSDFPILNQTVHGKPLVYLDNAATTQKPTQVLDKVTEIYNTVNSNIHRAVHTLSQQCTLETEQGRTIVQEFINAKHHHEIIFTRGTTESINLVASCFGELCNEGDDIIISALEHHSNIVPWQMIAERKGLNIKVIPMGDDGVLDMEAYEGLLSDKTAIVSVNHVSNALGTVNPIKHIIDKAHEYGAKVLIDGAQSIAHYKIDVQSLDCDFYAFSGHKIYAPTGIGVLYGKEDILNAMPPYQGGGDMIAKVTFEKTTYNELPFKFEAGTSDYVGAIALGEAIKYVNNIGIEAIESYENELMTYATEQLKLIEGIKIIGTAPQKSAVISFSYKDIHHFDFGTMLDQLGIAVRTGHHCTQPVMQRLGIEGTIRVSFALYNTKEEIDIFIAAVKRVAAIFG